MPWWELGLYIGVMSDSDIRYQPSRSSFFGAVPRLVWAAVVLGIFIRGWDLGHQSLSMDEVSELGLGAQSLQAIVNAADGFPPFFHFILYGWLRIFGSGETARWLSLIFGVLALPAAWLLGREVGGDRVGLWSVLLLTLSPIHIWYSQELRAYSLCFLLALMATWLLLRALRSDRASDWVAYGFVVICGLYTHYYYALLFPAFGLIALLEPTRPGRWRRLAQVHAAIAILSAPLLLLLRSDMQMQQNVVADQRPLDLNAVAYTLLTFVAGFSIGPSLRELHTASPLQSIRAVLPWALVLAPVTGFLLYAGLAAPPHRFRWWQLAGLVALPIAACGLLAATLGVGYRVRYISWCAGPLLVMLALGLNALRSQRLAAALFAVFAIVGVIAVANRHWGWRYMNEDTRTAARQIERSADRSTPVFVAPGYMAPALGAYLGPPWSLRRLTCTASPPDWEDCALQSLRRAGPTGGPFWLVYSRPFDGDPSGRILRGLRERGALRLISRMPGIELYRGTIW
jgi:4-amino-4-deoxy-L-arabinose transferase-like glycosyltransferase